MTDEVQQRVWAIADLHLAHGVDKPMDIFGDHWANHNDRIAADWDAKVAAEDIVLLPGDFSWATKAHELAPDMAWLAARPGRKVMSKGNHDYWWPKSQKKLTECIPEQTWALKKKALILPTTHGRLGILAVRGGDFAPLTKYGDNRTQATIDATLAKEIKELEASLNHLRELEQASTPCDATVCLFHYPPFPPGRDSSCFSELIHHSQARLCLYGHLHGEHVGDANVDGHHGTLRTRCVSCDQVDFALTDVTPWIW